MSATAQSPLGKRRLVIVDDHPIIRGGLAQFLAREPDLEVCGGCDNVTDALKLVEEFRPELVLVDMTLNDSHGIELVAEIKAHHSHVKTLVWSMFDEKVFAERALRAGAMGYINKKEPVEKVLEAIRLVLRGELYLSPQMTNTLLRRVGGGESLSDNPIGRLTDRELEVFEMIGNGLTTKQIARNLGLSPKTIEAHREKIKTKLNVRNAAELNRQAVQWVLESG